MNPTQFSTLGTKPIHPTQTQHQTSPQLLNFATEFLFSAIEAGVEAIWGRTLRQSLPLQAVPND